MLGSPGRPCRARRRALRYHPLMFGLGAPELIFILLLALLIFGPKKLPQIGRTLGRGMAEFRKASTELQRAINLEIDEVEKSPPSATTPKGDGALRSATDGPGLETPADTQPRESVAAKAPLELARADEPQTVEAPPTADEPQTAEEPQTADDGDGVVVPSS